MRWLQKNIAVGGEALRKKKFNQMHVGDDISRIQVPFLDFFFFQKYYGSFEAFAFLHVKIIDFIFSEFRVVEIIYFRDLVINWHPLPIKDLSSARLNPKAL